MDIAQINLYLNKTEDNWKAIRMSLNAVPMYVSRMHDIVLCAYRLKNLNRRCERKIERGKKIYIFIIILARTNFELTKVKLILFFKHYLKGCFPWRRHDRIMCAIALKYWVLYNMYLPGPVMDKRFSSTVPL